jgi:hypothetical protein
MANEKPTIRRESPESDDLFLDYDEVGGLFLETSGPRTRSSEDESWDGDEANSVDVSGIDLDDPREQQLLFSQLFDLLTESHVDPLMGFFQFRKQRQELIH